MMTRSRVLILAACAAAASAATAQPMPPPSGPRLYENVDVLGVMDCEVKGDIRLKVGGDRNLRCEYRPRGLPDVVQGYVLSIRTMEEGFFAEDDDYVCWTVLYLRDPARGYGGGASIAGDYAAALASVAEEYGLKEGALVGGSMKTFALEPRCEADRAGRNIADALRAVELEG